MKRKRRKTIFIDPRLEAIVVSSGGVGTTFLLEEILKFKKANASDNSDGYKHLRIPPLSKSGHLKVIYIFGDPVLACTSLFRRKYHLTLSIQNQKYLGKAKEIPLALNIDKYAKERRDYLKFENHFKNWLTKYPFYETLFVRYETLFSNLDEIMNFLELPSSFIVNFPKKKERSSNLDDLSLETLGSLQAMYGSFQRSLQQMPDVFLRYGKKPTIITLFLSSIVYRRAIVHAFFKKHKILRKVINKIKFFSRKIQ